MSKMRCHYEVLEVPMDASTEELTKSYRRLARTWHPDRNLHQLELAEERFKEIQAAYEILSDPAERSWYDQHREEILSGDSSIDHFECSNLWPYFSSSKFKGFGDDENGFYAVYRNIFILIDMEERKSTSGLTESPTFGTSTSDYEEVKQFYNHWQSFSTVRQFYWKDLYKVTEAPHRQVRRLMEKENKKERDKAKKEYNECVKKLVMFVKKRDVRLIDYMKKIQDEKMAQEAKKKEEMLLKKKQKKEARELAKKEAEKRLENLDLSQFDEDLIMDEKHKKKANLTDEENLEFYCPACKKKFKSEKQWENHEKSKKHLTMVSKMKLELLTEEDEEYNNKNDDLTQSENDLNATINEIYDNDEIDSQLDYEDPKDNINNIDKSLTSSNEDEDEDDEEFYLNMMANSMNNKSRFDILYEDNDIIEEEESIEQNSSENPTENSKMNNSNELKDNFQTNNRKQKKKRNKKR